MPLSNLQAKDWPPSSRGDAHDRILWVSFRNGNRDALDALYRKHLSGMYHHGMFVCKDPDVVRDGMQDLFSRLWSSRSRIADADSVQRYLYSSLKRIIILKISRERKHRLPLDDEGHIVVDPGGSIEQTFIDKEFKNERVAVIRKAMEKLTKHQREVVLLRFFNGLSYVQIAEIMELTIDSVYNLSSKAIEHLRVNLQFSRQLTNF
jgi:RNA polymerase sigma factor (sigma-70 family)